ncbi:MAG: glutamine amidotransferase [Steroidobacteraceae bacterium]
MTSKLAVALRHVHFEDCGTLEDALASRNIELRYVDVGHEGLCGVDPLAPDLLIALGAPVSVYEARRYPWILAELRLLERRLGAGEPTLGICLGAQMIAHALGARVFASDVKELGWQPLELTSAGADSVVRPLGAASMLHWHADTFDLPPGATLLASTPEVAQQIYTRGERVLGFQCHPEMRGASLEAWLIGHACEIAAAGVDPERLRSDTALHAPTLARQARAVFDRWLASAGV